jgi:hypothetical protein
VGAQVDGRGGAHGDVDCRNHAQEGQEGRRRRRKSREPADVVDAVRGAVERTFQATTGSTEGARDRGRSLLDDVASAAQRIRESFDDLRVLET